MVAFTAALSSTQSPIDGETVIFDVIVTSVGNSYNSETGVFTCPVGGLYVFTVNVLTWIGCPNSNECHAFVRLMKDGADVGYVVAYANSDSLPTLPGFSTNTFVVTCERAKAAPSRTGAQKPGSHSKRAIASGTPHSTTSRQKSPAQQSP